MNDQNPYSAPEALLDTGQQEFYQPNFISFRGRIGRLRYLAYGAGITIICFGAYTVLMGIVAGFGTFSNLSGEQGLPILLFVVMGLFYFGIFFFSIMFGKRRLNDLNRSGWWILLIFVPVFNLFIAIYLVFFPGSKIPNDYGPRPTENSIGVKILGLFLPLAIIAVIGILAAIAIPQYQSYVERAAQAQAQ